MISDVLVVVIGVGTVFVGLVALVLICSILSAVCKALFKDKPESQSKSAPAVATKNAAIENKQEILAGVCAVIAEELGTDVNNLKVTSFKRV